MKKTKQTEKTKQKIKQNKLTNVVPIARMFQQKVSTIFQFLTAFLYKKILKNMF